MIVTAIAFAYFAFAGDADVIEVQRCGPVCLAVIARSLGVDTSYSMIDQRIPHDRLDSSFLELETIAKEIGLSTIAVAWKTGEIPPFSKRVHRTSVWV